MSLLVVTGIKSLGALTPPVFKDTNNVEIGTLCRAWVKFNGTGTPTIDASFNVSSITDVNVGTYGINFTNTMSDAKYCVVYSGRPATDVVCNPFEPYAPTYGTRSVNTVFLRYANQSATAIDPDICSVAVFR